MKMSTTTDRILHDIQTIINKADGTDLNKAMNQMVGANNIITIGAGRVGLVMQMFAMRLGHLGLKSHHFTDTTLPALNHKDVLIVGSGSGQTPTILSYVTIAKKNKVPVILFTANNTSPIKKRSDIVIHIPGPHKGMKSTSDIFQPMTTVFEQSLLVYLDALVLELINKLKKTSKDLQESHTNLE
jgi:6-phospho-3-hexuloisomerase